MLSTQMHAECEFPQIMNAKKLNSIYIWFCHENYQLPNANEVRVNFAYGKLSNFCQSLSKSSNTFTFSVCNRRPKFGEWFLLGLWGCDMWHIETKTENYFVQKHSSSIFARRAHTNAFHIPISLGSHVNVCANASIVGTYSVENMMKNNFFICTINNIVNFRIAEASHVYRYQSSAVVGCHCHCLSSPAIHFRQILPLFRCVLMRLNREVGYVNDCSGSACDDTFELGCTAAAKKSRNRKTF